MSLRSSMVVTAVAATLAALVAVVTFAHPALRRQALEQAEASLLAEARLMARVVEDALAWGAGSELDALVDAAAAGARARVTIVGPDGSVLADSTASGADLLAMPNHGDRPEIRAALGGRAGRDLRWSATLSRELVYAAVPVRREGRVLAAARVALPFEAVSQSVRDLWRATALAFLLALLVAGAVSVALSGILAGSRREIIDAARRFAGGELDARVPVRRGDELGELARILNQSADRLQQRLAETARAQARTDAILSAMEDGVLAVDHRGIVILANRTLLRALEVREPLGRHYVEVIRQTEVGAVVEKVLHAGERQEAEVEILHLKRVYALTAAPFPGDEGTPHGAVVTFHDATQRRRLDRMRRDFVANASHELRTPLTSVRGFVEALEDGALDEPKTAQRFLGKIRTHADRMAALVEDLLELSRLESGEQPPQWAPVDAAEVAADAVAAFAGLAQKKSLVLEHAERGPANVVSDAQRLRRILDNLVENAIKYTPPGGRVEVVTSPAPGGGALVEVNDDGPGIGAEHLPRIFERFYRVDTARSRELGGTGLGLSIVKHLAEGMGAAVSVDSELGSGSRFRVVLPPDAGLRGPS